MRGRRAASPRRPGRPATGLRRWSRPFCSFRPRRSPWARGRVREEGGGRDATAAPRVARCPTTGPTKDARKRRGDPTTTPTRDDDGDGRRRRRSRRLRRHRRRRSARGDGENAPRPRRPLRRRRRRRRCSGRCRCCWCCCRRSYRRIPRKRPGPWNGSREKPPRRRGGPSAAGSRSGRPFLLQLGGLQSRPSRRLPQPPARAIGATASPTGSGRRLHLRPQTAERRWRWREASGSASRRTPRERATGGTARGRANCTRATKAPQTTWRRTQTLCKRAERKK